MYTKQADTEYMCPPVHVHDHVSMLVCSCWYASSIANWNSCLQQYMYWAEFQQHNKVVIGVSPAAAEQLITAAESLQ